MKVILPAAITAAVLTASSVPETDYAAWATGTTYALGDRVISASTHRIYESAVAGNVGNDPTTGATQWIDAGPTNRWAMFDQAANGGTSLNAAIVLTLALPATVDAVGMVDVQAASVRVVVTAGATTLFDQTHNPSQAAEVFSAIPTGAGRVATVTITPAAGAIAIVGKMAIGTLFDLGPTEDGPTIALQDFSKRTTDDFGVTTVVERSWSKKTTVRTRLDSSVVDTVQNTLAGVRATPLIWIGDDAFPCLTGYGFYSDFSVDLAIGATSFCSLTFSGLPSVDIAAPAFDPAISGASNFRALRPFTVGDATLAASTVPETDHAAWSNATAYFIGDRVILAHRIYESLTDLNTGHDPTTDTANWLDVGPTNRWAMFDQALGTVTAKSGGFSVTLTAPAATTALAILDATVASVRVQAPGYDQTKTIVAGSAGNAIFLDLAVTSGAAITVTFAPLGDGTAAVGTLLFGTIDPFGVTETSPTVGITDYSLKTTDDFGNTTPVERAWSKRMVLRSLLASSAVDNVMRRVATLRAVPTLWIADDAFSSLAVYGFFRDFTVTLGANASTASVTIEGLAKAAPPSDEPTNAELLAAIDAAAKANSRTFAQDEPPTAEESKAYDIWFDTNDGNKEYRRLPGSGLLSIGGHRIRFTGHALELAPWVETTDTRLPQVTADLAGALAEIAALGSDAVLSAGSDKRQARVDFAALSNNYASLNAKYIALGSPADLTPVRSSAVTAFNALGAYLDSLVPAWDDMTQDTAVSPATWQDNWTNAYAAISAFGVGISGRPGIIPRGNYDPTATYFLNNSVSYNGGSYLAVRDNFSGQAPSGTGQATAYWDVLAAPGDAGAPSTPPSAFSATIDLTAGAAVNLRAAADAAGYTGHSDATITFRVPVGVTIRGLGGGGIGIDTGTWPDGYTIALTLQISGTVDGGGGRGGNASGGSGGEGGDAIFVRVPLSGGITINAGGILRGGGGGGGAGSSLTGKLGAGGGGGGAPNGIAGAGADGWQTDGVDGSPGTTSGGGAGGGNGADGGTFGAAGSNSTTAAGGPPGYAVRKNGFTAAVTNNGTMIGSAA